ncbi:MAG: zf-HC2 domain-containing protein [Eubacteriales bacterium]|nr:zf-HC2 domain-containing protein [Eubacteriales bacterium]
MSEINCGIIRDLLPLYAENMLGEDSRKTVEEHLASCGECREKYEQMTRKVAVPEIANEEEAKPLKKFRFHVLFNIIGFPLWLPLLLAAAITVLSLFFSLWVTVICLWCVPISCGASAVACIIGSIVDLTHGYLGNTLILLGGFFTAGGIAILSYFGCLWLTKKFVFMSSYLTGRLARLFGKGKKHND